MSALAPELKSAIDHLWQANANFPCCQIHAYAAANPCSEAVLFIGLNPSLSDINIARQKTGPVADLQFYNLDYANSVENHAYYRAFPELTPTGIPWTHIDLLFFQETNQKFAEALLKSHPDFIRTQLEVSLTWTIQLCPRAIVVANAFAGRLFRDHQLTAPGPWDQLQCQWNPNLGTYIANMDSRKVPVFFTSMLTGQRALDNGSKERLRWHIAWALQQIA